MRVALGTGEESSAHAQLIKRLRATHVAPRLDPLRHKQVASGGLRGPPLIP